MNHNYCAICSASNPVSNSTFEVDEQTITRVNQTDYCNSCTGLINYYTKTKKMLFAAVIEKLVKQFAWLSHKPKLNHERKFAGY